jgi:hypothetical protein
MEGLVDSEYRMRATGRMYGVQAHSRLLQTVHVMYAGLWNYPFYDC